MMTAEQLKASILQLAMEGKLVEQRTEEGSVLTEAIYQRDDRWYEKVGGKELDITEQLPYSIPSSWSWTRVKYITTLYNGRAFKPSEWSQTGLPIVRIQNLNDDKAPYNYFQGEAAREHILRGGELLFAWSGTPGTSFGAHIWKNREAVLNQHIFKIEFNDSILDKRFFALALNQRVTLLIQLAHGSAGLQHVTKKVFDSTLIPIPPLAEQYRIVEKIEELMPFVDQYATASEKLDKLNSEFPDKVKKSILQLAVEGKLVEQRPEEGTGEELFRKIQEEKAKLIKEGKIKKQKPLADITDEEKPFDIPESWSWVRIGEISSTVTKGTTPRGGNTSYSTSGIGFLRAENIAGLDSLNLSNLKYVTQKMNDGFLSRSIIMESDLLITIAGTLGRTALVRKADLPLNANQAVSIVRLVNPQKLDLLFIIYALNASAIQRSLVSQKKITAIPNLTLEIISNCCIPLPPLAEQHRIVAKLNEILPKIER